MTSLKRRFVMSSAVLAGFALAGTTGVCAEGALAHTRLGFAWQALIELGVLKDGITVDEAKAILGPPTHPQPRNKDRQYIHWHYHSTMHTNPRLVADLRNGKLYNIRVGSRK